MAKIATDAAVAFRDWVTDGQPSSGPQKPVKADVRAVFAAIDTALSRRAAVLATITDLRAINAAAECNDGERAFVMGRVAACDGPIRVFRWDAASTSTHDGVTILRPTTGAASTGAGRWLLDHTNPRAVMTSGDATPSVAGVAILVTAGSTAITMFDDAFEGQRLLVERGAADIVITHNASLIDNGAGDITLTATAPRAEYVFAGGVHRLITHRQQFSAAANALLNSTSALAQRAALQLSGQIVRTSWYGTTQAAFTDAVTAAGDGGEVIVDNAIVLTGVWPDTGNPTGAGVLLTQAGGTIECAAANFTWGGRINAVRNFFVGANRNRVRFTSQALAVYPEYWGAIGYSDAGPNVTANNTAIAAALDSMRDAPGLACLLQAKYSISAAQVIGNGSATAVSTIHRQIQIIGARPGAGPGEYANASNFGFKWVGAASDTGAAVFLNGGIPGLRLEFDVDCNNLLGRGVTGFHPYDSDIRINVIGQKTGGGLGVYLAAWDHPAYANAHWAQAMSVNAAGSGYEVGDLVALAGGAPNIRTIARVDAVSGGGVTAVSTFEVGSYQSSTEPLVPPPPNVCAALGGAGSGLTLNITMAGAEVATVAVSAGGSGYVVGEIVAISGGTRSSTAMVEVVAVSSGAVTGLKIVQRGNYSVAPTLTGAATRRGAGASFNATWSGKYSAGTTQGLMSNRLHIVVRSPNGTSSACMITGGPKYNIGCSRNRCTGDLVRGSGAFDESFISNFCDGNVFDFFTVSSGATPTTGIAWTRMVQSSGALADLVHGENIIGPMMGIGAIRNIDSATFVESTRGGKDLAPWGWKLSDGATTTPPAWLKIVSPDGVLRGKWAGTQQLMHGKAVGLVGSKFCFPSGVAAPQATEAAAEMTLGAGIVVDFLRVNSRVAPGGSGTRGYVVRKNGADTAQNIIYTSAQTGDRIDTDAVSFNGGDRICFYAYDTGGAANADVDWSIGIRQVEVL